MVFFESRCDVGYGRLWDGNRMVNLDHEWGYLGMVYTHGILGMVIMDLRHWVLHGFTILQGVIL